jgi:hypothetical protein
MAGTMLQTGTARDLLTGANVDDPQVLAFDRVDLEITQAREIVQISATPVRPGVEALVGARAGGHLRAAIGEALPAEARAGTPLYLLLDDLGGASLVAPFAWTQWNAQTRRQMVEALDLAAMRQKMVGVCIGFAPGSLALDPSRDALQRNGEVPSLGSPDDRHGWHELTEWSEISARRARCIDVWFEGEDIVIEAFFQDSAATQTGERQAVHEYLLSARADRRTATLRAVTADPRILPFEVCPSAILNIGRMVGTPLADLRRAVVERLPRTDGCTHLNDTLRALAEVPQLAAALADTAAAATS